MQIVCRQEKGFRLQATSGGTEIPMDAKKPIGSETAPTPKELLVAAVCGCTAMDVIGLMKKYRQQLDSLDVVADVVLGEDKHPHIFRSINLTFDVKGLVEPAKLLEAVRLSQTQYCGVSAMLAKTVAITYDVKLNEEPIGSGSAHFENA